MDDLAISVRDVSKCYQVFDGQGARLLHALWPGRRAGVQQIWALKDIAFEVRRGESLAVIGRNGGGKSTLLEILTGTLAPTSGEVRVNGRVSALLELGSGFNPEYTGRDNVILNGLLLGLTREEILRRFDEIVAFAEIGDALERPVKTYSSGMMMRLAFAVQVLTDPDILIIDEALSVGDFFFQQKCLGYIRSLCEKGVTVLFVSHDMGTVRDLCTRAVYLKQGKMIFVGDSQTAIRHYLAEASSVDGAPCADSTAAAVEIGDADFPADAFWKRPAAHPAGPLLAVEILGRDGVPVTHARIGETVRMRVYFHAPATETGHISLVVKNRYDQVVSSVSSYASGLPPLSSGSAAFAIFQIEIDMMLEAGLYSLQVGFGRPAGKNKGNLVDATGWMGPFRIDWDYERETAPFLGMFGLPARGELFSRSNEAVGAGEAKGRSS
jgi:lipopolysaccharide transport system ATP-binding protein